MGNNSLPEGWVWRRVDEIGEVVTGTTPSKKVSSYYGDKYPFYKPIDLNAGFDTRTSNDGLSEEGIAQARLLPKKSILVTCIGATIGKTGFIHKEGASNQQINAIIPFPNVLPEFVYYSCISPQFQKSILENASSTTLPILNKSKFSKLLFPIPPYPEQERIVAKLEETFTQLEAGVVELQNAKTQLKRYRAAVLKSAVEGELTREWREAHRGEVEPAENLLARILSARREKWEAEGGKGKYKEPTATKIENLPELPDGWMWTNTGKLCDCIVPNRDKPKSFSGDIPWITLPDFDDTSIRIKNSKSGMGLTEEEARKYRAKIIPKGSVVMSCVGRFGITGVVEQDLVVNQQLHAFLVPEEMLEAKYLAYAIKTQVPYMEEISTATTIAYLNKSNCNSVPIPLPPLDEQRRIVEKVERRLSVADEIEKELAESLVRAERLRGSILKNAFEGKL